MEDVSYVRGVVVNRIARLRRHLPESDIDEMVGIAVQRFLTYGSYDPARGSMKTYLYYVASNVVTDYVMRYDRHRERHTSLDESGQDDGTFVLEQDTDRGEVSARIAEAFLSLSERNRKALKLAGRGMKPREIAKALGCTPNAAATLLHRARAAFAQALGPDVLSRYGIAA